MWSSYLEHRLAPWCICGRMPISRSSSASECFHQMSSPPVPLLLPHRLIFYLSLSHSLSLSCSFHLPLSLLLLLPTSLSPARFTPGAFLFLMPALPSSAPFHRRCLSAGMCVTSGHLRARGHPSGRQPTRKLSSCCNVQRGACVRGGACRRSASSTSSRQATKQRSPPQSSASWRT